MAQAASCKVAKPILNSSAGLDHMLVISEEHLERVFDEYRGFFNHARPHQGIDPGQKNLVDEVAEQITHAVNEHLPR
jgi:hypothetical protein